jgi:hypothetical protein
MVGIAVMRISAAVRKDSTHSLFPSHCIEAEVTRLALISMGTGVVPATEGEREQGHCG